MSADTLATVSGIRRILWKVAIFLVLLLIAVAVSPSIYKAAKIVRYNILAENARKTGDLQTALFYAHSVRQLDPRNDKATGLIAAISAEGNQPSALMWLAGWTELNPKDPTRLASLGKMAVVRNQIPVAETCLKNLKKLPDANPDDVLELESSLLVRTGKTREALNLFKQASAATTNNPRLSLNHGILLLSQPEPTLQQEGIVLLQSLCLKPESLFPASESLIRYAFDKKNPQLARQSAGILSRKTNLDVREYLLLTEVELFLNGKLPEPFHREIIVRINGKSSKIAQVIGWLLKHRQLDEMDNLIAHYRSQKEAPPVINHLYASRMAERGEWENLLETLQEPEWKELGSYRYAFLIQACRALGRPDLDNLKKRFSEALALELRKQPQEVFAVDRLAGQWRWNEERLEIWNAVAEGNKLPSTYLKNELSLAQRKKDTLLLYGLGNILLKRFPEDRVLRNNLITYALLLNLQPGQQLKEARKLIEAHPTDPSLKTTYALALLKNGQPAEAVAQYADFSETELQNPEVAAYYAMALLANKQVEKATPYLSLSRKAFLLPEEKALLKQ